jgi:hypothetical protein
MSPLLDPVPSKGSGPRLKPVGDVPSAGSSRQLLPMLSDSGDLNRKFYSVPEGPAERELDTLMGTVKARAATAHVSLTPRDVRFVSCPLPWLPPAHAPSCRAPRHCGCLPHIRKSPCDVYSIALVLQELRQQSDSPKRIESPPARHQRAFKTGAAPVLKGDGKATSSLHIFDAGVLGTWIR